MATYAYVGVSTKEQHVAKAGREYVHQRQADGYLMLFYSVSSFTNGR